jgi:glyoxylase-like metal-dependent hydrolase (beta-lactamase superfamily II)
MGKHMIIKKIVSGIMKSNSYVIACEVTHKGVVIDPCGRINQMMKFIQENGIEIEYIFNTHFHADHTGGNKKLKRMTGAKILIHRNDITYLRQIINGIKIATLNFSISPVPEMIVDDDDIEIRVGDLNFKIFQTPGHTPGGICFYVNGCLFTGDTLFVGDSGATCFKGGNRQDLGKSIRRLMNELPGNTVIYPGHDYGPMVTSTLDWEKRNNKNAKEYGYYAP